MSCNNLPSPSSVLPNHSIKRRSQSFSSSKTLLTLSPSQGKSPSKTDHISNNKQTSPFLRESPSAGSRGLKKNCDDLSQHKPKLEPNCTTRQRSLSGNVISSKPTWKPSTLATTHHHSLSQSFNTATTSTSSSPLCTTLLSSTITTSSSSSVFSTIKFGPGPSRSNSASTTRSASMTPSSSSSHLAEPASAPPSPSGPPECKWKGCKASPLEANNLLDHLRLHAETHIKKKKYGCMWIGCKVYNKPSQSGSWLERHVVGHSGHRPFKCILGDCGQRFQSQASLERHVNSHFVAMAAKDAKTSRSKEEATSHRLALRRRRQLKRRSVQAVKKSDMFDESTMSAVRQELLSLTEAARVDLNTPTVNATFQGQIVGQRKLYSGSSTTESLVDFSPAHILSPQWLPQSEAVCLSDISVPLARLPTDSVTDLHRSLYRRHRFRKHRRK